MILQYNISIYVFPLVSICEWIENDSLTLICVELQLINAPANPLLEYPVFVNAAMAAYWGILEQLGITCKLFYNDLEINTNTFKEEQVR